MHGAALTGLYAAGAFGLPLRSRPVPVALMPLSLAEWHSNRGVSGAEPPALPPPPEKPLQIVSLPPDTQLDPLRAEIPPPAGVRLLAERDQTVERETISRHADSNAKVLRVPQQKARGRRGAGERGEHKVAVRGRTGPQGGGGADPDAAAPEPPPPAAPAADDPARSVGTAYPGLPPPDSSLPGDGEGGQRVDGPRVAGMPLQEYPTPDGGPNFDGLGVPEGTETRLHTRRFAPAAYWTDVRARIQDDWHRRALAVLQAYDPHEDMYFYKPRTVRIAVTLNSQGAVTDVHVLESSRLDFYDAIALAAVKDKQPFPPPPPAAIRSDGSARINMVFTWLPSVERPRQLR
jgi:TonB family protein